MPRIVSEGWLFTSQETVNDNTTSVSRIKKLHCFTFWYLRTTLKGDLYAIGLAETGILNKE